MKYKISEYAKLHKVTQRTVWNWIKKGELQIEYTPTGRVRIVIYNPNEELKVAVYARVSSSENKDNLLSQENRLISYCNAKGYKVIKSVKEIGSGINDMRPKLEALLMDNSIDIIVVEHKDKLCRFGINYIEKLLSLQGRKIEIVNPVVDDKEDLIQDFISIITSFCSRIYGLRRTKRNAEKLIRELSNNEVS